ncbi:dTDP-4-dehydrorhamnose reductase (plasmid) [Bradyrhizobium sp. 155]|uniref:dTDP-4-dehydrorhamnose reductase n=1 Tax=unclassified Bradyrhizobium TaxID=2631580 RepID=UPI001FF85EFB|nr:MULTISPECIES: dTDP-4-dehydrorhamnose reductase [unclassified Bradyrhizobium]MCK1326712.1 dTDP-4-dehydrorhamnose reductase [Bradyrhizobium sp. 156]UPK16058.1 dTDP-4-dehydrorhamnose reductase [Bradyrhizobium sp. 155]
MRILLTGTSGQVGGALQPILARLGTIIAPNLNEFDLSKPDTLVGALDTFQPDLIINPAAYTAVDRAEDERELAFRINAGGPGVIAQWAAKRRVPLVHFSTDYVFDGSGKAPWREDSPTRPLSVYGASKLAGDTAICAAGGPHLIARTSWVYAAKGANFLRTIARLAAERKELRIVADQIGAPTTARTIANAIANIVLPNLSNLNELFARKGGVVNLICAGETSWHGFASAIIAGLRSRGLRLEVESVITIATADFPTKAMRPRNSRLDLSRLKRQFGMTTPNWQEALSVELDDFVALQEKAARADPARQLQQRACS